MDIGNDNDSKQGGDVEEGEISRSSKVPPGPPPIRPGPPPVRTDYLSSKSSRDQSNDQSRRQEDERTHERDHQHHPQEYRRERRDYEYEARDYHRSQREDPHQYHEERNAEDQPRRPAPATQLRLVKITSDVLPEEQKVALVDGRNEAVSIGRDRSFTARIRCPSMEISKHHANIFRMANDKGSRNAEDWLFAVADTGSTHGTYILLDCPPALSADSLPPITAYERLSPSKKASIPKCLRHLSLLRVGKTVFQAHLHPGRDNLCEDCSINEEHSNEIPLKVPEKKEVKASSIGAEGAAQSVQPVKVALKRAIRDLKSRHLGDEAESESSHFDYVDRAAARRARGGVPVVQPVPSTPTVAAAPLAAPTVSVPAAKLDATNRGFQMFSSMSGQIGTASMQSHDPILARGVEGRAGLGSKRLLDVQEMASRPSGYSPESVRERQRRRFEESR